MDEKVMSKIKPGAKIRVWERIREGEKERTSAFEGLIIARKHGSEPGATFTIRRIISGIGVERIFPIHSPKITKVEIIQSPKKVKRAKLYYIRKMSARRVREKVG